MEKHGHVVSQTLTKPQQRLAVSLIQENTRLQRHSTRGPSSAIFGILKGMKEAMETNMAKNAEDEEEADAKEKNAKSKVDLEDTTESKKADTEFLQNLKLKCDEFANEYDKRKKVRNEELKAVSETISIL